nr:nucleoside hydrolase [Kineosporia babensis]
MVIDTDTAQDDCVAILAGLLTPEADLRGITMVAGNVGFDRQVKNAFMTFNVAAKQVPMYLGSRLPLVRPWESAENVHGDGAGGLDMDFSGFEPEAEHAVDALLRMADEAAGELNVVAIGPLTNIALAVRKRPEFASQVKHLVVMGGSNNARGNITAAAEFNFYVDPEAAKIVFDAGFNVTVVPWAPLTLKQAVFGRDVLDRIAQIETPLAHFFTSVCSATLAFDESVGIPGTTHPDSLSVAVLLRPELVTKSAQYNVDIETGSELTRGYAAMSWGVHGLAANATVIEEIDADGFRDFLLDMLGQTTQPPREFTVAGSKI